MCVIKKSPRARARFRDGGQKRKSTKLVERHLGVPKLGGLGDQGEPAVDRRAQVAGLGAVPAAMSQEGAIMAEPGAALQPHYSGFSCPCVRMTGDADRGVDPEYQSIRRVHALNDAEPRNDPWAVHIVHNAVPLEVAETINRVVSDVGRLQDMA